MFIIKKDYRLMIKFKTSKKDKNIYKTNHNQIKKHYKKVFY